MAWLKFGQSSQNASSQTLGINDAPTMTVEQLRSRAKKRLIGSLVLVGVAVVGFPLLFDTQPRPALVDVPIEIPDKNKVKPLSPAPVAVQSAKNPNFSTKVETDASLSGKEEVLSSASSAKAPALTTGQIATGAAVATAVGAGAAAAVAAVKSNDKNTENSKEKPPKTPENSAQTAPKIEVSKTPEPKPVPSKPEPKPIVKPEPRVDAKPVAKVESKPESKPEPKPPVKPDPKETRKDAQKADAAKAQALLEGKAPATPAETAASKASPAERYIVQFGAFSENAKAREARLKVERAGMTTYVHVAQTPDGQRIRVRVGPFASKAEAEKVATKIKAIGLPAAILTL